MPNTFGTSAVQVPLIDSRHAQTYRQRFMREDVRELSYANGLYVPCGGLPARGWILLSRKDYDLIIGYGTSYQLHLDACDGVTPEIVLGNLAIVQSQCISTGILDDPNAVFLVELTDARGVLSNPWFEFPTKSYYNVLSPAYPQNYYVASLNAGTAWTWSGMIENLWDQMGTFLGTYPGLPDVPAGTPTNWNLPGVSAWKSLTMILDHLGMGVSCDLTQAEPYGIISMGDSDAAFDTLTAKYSGRVQDDANWTGIGSGRVPGTVVVYFRRVNQYYGTEETVRRDSDQWATSAVYPVSVAAPAFFTGAAGTGFLYDDFPVRYDVDNVPLAADVVTATAIAAERVSQYFDLIYSRTSGQLLRTYTGALPFYAGSQVDGVSWRQDIRGNRNRAGWTTQIIRGDVPKMWSEIYP